MSCFHLVLVLVMLSLVEVGLGQNYYITWSDLRMEDGGMAGGVGVGVGESQQNSGWNDRVIVVDWSGRGDSGTVQGAVDMVPENNAHRVKIRILPGVYREKVIIPINKPYISFIGDQDQSYQTVISWHDKASDPDGNGGTLGTLNSATVTVLADYFCAMGITFENTVVEPPDGRNGFQGVALRIAGNKAVFYKTRFLGSQDTLLDDSGSHYFYQCFIQGSVDFIFGNARSLYQQCAISVVNDGYAIAAQHRNSASEDTGFSFVNCTVTGTGPVYLGRAWGNYSRTIYSYSQFDLNVRPQGWDDWRDPSRQSTVTFGEYECQGNGANRSGRVPWSKALNIYEALPYLTTAYINGQQWLRL